MPSRCPDCNKFVSLETESELYGEPEVALEDGVLTATVRIVRTCADCSTELKEATVDLDYTLPTYDKFCSKGGEHQLDVEYELEVEEGGGGRYAKNIISAIMTGTVSCSKCGDEYEFDMKDGAAASHFDDLT